MVQALALEAGDDLAGQAARERVGLDQDQGPVHGDRAPFGSSEGQTGGRSLEDVGGARLGRRAGAGGGAAGRRAGRVPGRPRPRSTGRSASCGSSGLPQVGARVLELAQAVRAAQEVLLDLVVAVRAEEVAELGQPRLGRLHLELALAHVVEVLRRAHDHVDDRPDEREQRGRVRAQPTSIGSAIRRRASANVQYTSASQMTTRNEDQQVDGQVQAVVVDPEDGEARRRRKLYAAPTVRPDGHRYRNIRPKQ